MLKMSCRCIYKTSVNKIFQINPQFAEFFQRLVFPGLFVKHNSLYYIQYRNQKIYILQYLTHLFIEERVPIRINDLIIHILFQLRHLRQSQLVEGLGQGFCSYIQWPQKISQSIVSAFESQRIKKYLTKAKGCGWWSSDSLLLPIVKASFMAAQLRHNDRPRWSFYTTHKDKKV